jgi:DNA helicase-2/ATP-dependent DNA helicase PcrA
MAINFIPNEAQRRVVEFPVDRPLKVIAGAGTGKTAVLTNRFVHIVNNHAIPAPRILALTFTRKAAAEMRSRIVGQLLDEGLMGGSEAPLMLWIGNFHSICLRLLRQHALSAGLDPSFDVIDETERNLLMGDVVSDFLDNRLPQSSGAGQAGRFKPLMVDRAGDFEENAIRLIGRLRGVFADSGEFTTSASDALDKQYRHIETILNATICNESLRKNARSRAEKEMKLLPAARAHEQLLLQGASAIFDAYEKRIAVLGNLDFNELVSRACRLAESDRSIRKRFDYILVDEFQDTDGMQFRLLEALSDNLKNVTVVCDRKQSIYEWREARIENIDEFPGETIHLSENYRSCGEILDAANYFIAQTMPEEEPLQPATDGGRGRAGSAVVTLHRAQDADAEAAFVAGEIAALIDSGECTPSDVAILMRSVRASGRIEDTLRSLDIPVSVVGGRGFFDLSETRDLLALLTLIENPFDDLSMARILASPAIGLSDFALSSLRRDAEGHTRCFFDAIQDSLKGEGGVAANLRPTVRRRLEALMATIATLANRKWEMTAGEVISGALAGVGYLKYLASIEGVRGERFPNVSLFYKQAAQFEERHPGAALREFLEYFERSLLAGTGPSATLSACDAVQIMSVHQAKGLEFPVVFVMNLKSKAFPLAFRTDRFGYDEKVGLYARKLPGGDDNVRYKGGYGGNIQESLKHRQLLEENRIMYVAVTRAERLLYLTAPTAKADKPAIDFLARMELFAASDGIGTRIVEAREHPAARVGTEGSSVLPMASNDILDTAADAVERIERGAGTVPDAGAGVLRLSYSRLALMRFCPMKYAMRYVYNLPLAPHEDSFDEVHGGTHGQVDAFTLGTLLHSTLMRFHRARKDDAENADASDIFRKLSGALPRGMVEAGVGMLERYIEHPLSRNETLYEETDFHWKIVADSIEIMFEGKVDRIHREGERLKIVDYKTGMPNAEAHEIQLAIYKMAMEETLGEEGMLTSNYYLSAGEEASCEFSAERLSEIRAGIIEDARKIAAGDFSMPGDGKKDTSPSSRPDAEAGRCRACGYKSFCEHRE